MNIDQEMINNEVVEARSIHASKMEAFETMAGGIIHEFNNVLFPIIGYAEMLKEDLSDCQKQRARADRILLAAFQAKELVQQISTFVKGKASKPRSIKLYPIIKEALKLHRSSIPKSIDIESEIDANCGMVHADPVELYYAIISLVASACPVVMDTACKISVSLKEVTVDISESDTINLTPGNYACISISVSGSSVEENVMDRISNRAIEDERGPKWKLSTVHKFARDYGGDLFITSELTMRKETRLLLPVARKSIVEALDSPRQSVGGSECILIIDDEKSVVSMEKTMLERLGYRVTALTDSREALILFKKNPFQFNLVISDMAMPDMTGDKLSIELMKIRKDIPVILCTGYAIEFAEDIALETGVMAVVQKPVQKDDFAKTIRNVIDDARQLQT